MNNITEVVQLMDKTMKAIDAIDEARNALRCREDKAPCEFCKDYVPCQMLATAARALSTAVNVIH